MCYNIPGVCVLLYDDYDRGVNLIEGNVAVNIASDNGIQVTAGAIIRNNIVLGWGSREYRTNACTIHEANISNLYVQNVPPLVWPVTLL